MALGITEDDFLDAPLADFGVNVAWEDANKTTHNISGAETLTYATASNKTVVFRKRAQRYEQTEEGLVDRGDAIVLSKESDGFAKDDKITYDGEEYIITSVIRRGTNGTHLFDTCTLIKL